MNSQIPLRFAVLLEGVQLNQWQAECVSRLIASGTATLELIINAAPRQHPPRRRAVTLMRHGLWQRYLLTLGPRCSTGAADPKLFHDVEALACKACGRDGTLELEESAIGQIRSRRLDFILHFGERTPVGGLVKAAGHGLWCFRFGDPLDPLGPLAAFRAILRRDNVLRVELVRLLEGRGVRLLRDGYFAVPDYSFKKTLAGSLNGSVDFPLLACRDLLAGHEFAKPLPNSPSAHRAIRMPGNALMLEFFIRTFARKAVGFAQMLLTRVQWNTGFLDSTLVDPFSITTARNVRWLPTKSAKDFAADPFFLRHGDIVTLLFEQLDPANNCGRIAACQFEGDKTVPLGIVIEEAVHLSYPCLVQSQGQIYCVPEQSEAKSIIIYRALDFPLRWERVGSLLPGIEAVDSTLFQHGGYWWIAYTDASIDRNGRLMLWYANELTGPWRPHALNPVKIDPRCSRGAGPPFIHRGALVRPSQDCSVSYGSKIIFNRVVTLTPDQFHEEVIGELRPDPAGPYSRGLHTISYDGSVAIVDGVRLLVDLTALSAKIRARLRRRPSIHPKLAFNHQSPAG